MITSVLYLGIMLAFFYFLLTFESTNKEKMTLTLKLKFEDEVGKNLHSLQTAIINYK